MTKNPISINKDELAAKALSLMNSKKLLLCVYMERMIKLKLLEFYIFIIFLKQISLK